MVKDKRKYKRDWMRRYRAAHPEKFRLPIRPSRATKPKRQQGECPSCHNIFPRTEEFFQLVKDKRHSAGTYLSAECRSCRRKRFRKFYAQNPAAQVKRAYDFVKNNPSAKAAKNNRDAVRYARRKKRGCPPWADQSQLQTIYMIADFLTDKTGTAFEVDHVYPLIHPALCGLHVPWNLRVITAKENQAKGNRLPT